MWCRVPTLHSLSPTTQVTVVGKQLATCRVNVYMTYLCIVQRVIKLCQRIERKASKFISTACHMHKHIQRMCANQTLCVIKFICLYVKLFIFYSGNKYIFCWSLILNSIGSSSFGLTHRVCSHTSAGNCIWKLHSAFIFNTSELNSADVDLNIYHLEARIRYIPTEVVLVIKIIYSKNSWVSHLMTRAQAFEVHGNLINDFVISFYQLMLAKLLITICAVTARNQFQFC